MGDNADASASDAVVPGVVPQTAAAGVAAAAGIAIGGPVGALVAGMSLPSLVNAAQKSWDELTAKRRDNVVNVIGQTAARLGLGPEELVDSLGAAAESEALLAEAIQASAETLDGRKVAALARAVAHGVENDQARVDQSLMIVRALREIETPHVRLLAKLPANARGRELRGVDEVLVAVLQRAGLADDGAYGRAIEAIDERIKALEQATNDAISRNTRTRMKRPSGTKASRSRAKWHRTSFGTECLDYLRVAAKEVDLEPIVAEDVQSTAHDEPSVE